MLNLLYDDLKLMIKDLEEFNIDAKCIITDEDCQLVTVTLTIVLGEKNHVIQKLFDQHEHYHITSSSRHLVGTFISDLWKEVYELKNEEYSEINKTLLLC